VNRRSACLLLGLCHAGSAAALGLGEIGLRSYLGQPLHATVAVLDAPADMAADCFRIEAGADSIAAPLRAQFDIERTGGQARLHIRTAEPVYDPIAQFVLVSDCQVRLQREYVVLLDPPSVEAPAVGQDAPTTVQADAPAVAAAPPPRQVARRPGVASRPSGTVRRPPAAPRARATPESAAPRLVLSGKRRFSDPAASPFALRLDTTLPDLTRPRPENLTATELSDENTALTRKLAYLEARLAALQQRNAQLDRRAAAPATPAPPPPGKPARWPLYLLAIGLLAGGGALAAWLYRRSHPRETSLADDRPWTEPAPWPTLSEMAKMPEAGAAPAPQRMPEVAAPPHDEGTEVKEDILDQAEVYMAHGHADLAIHLLQEHLREAPTESPVPWLLLLDLLHRAGDTAGYAAASTECRRYFNVNLTDHPISQDNDSGEGLEAYPHLMEQLVKVWTTPERDAFIKDLIYDDRGGTRMGFEPSAYRDILLLRTLAQDAPLTHAA
jgi:hypothetical protein